MFKLWFSLLRGEQPVGLATHNLRDATKTNKQSIHGALSRFFKKMSFTTGTPCFPINLATFSFL